MRGPTIRSGPSRVLMAHPDPRRADARGAPVVRRQAGRRQFTGRALVTLGLTAAVVAYDLRELENWHARVSKYCRDNPLLGVYEQHPLYQPTQWVHGFTMFNQEQRPVVTREARRATQSCDATDLPTAA